MGKHDIEPGGEDYEWANAIEGQVKRIGELTRGRLKFIEMRPFDKYQGPYARVEINGRGDSIWGVNDGMKDYLYIENLDWTGTPANLARAILGDKKSAEVALKKTNLMR